MEAELTIGAVLGGDITLLSGTATVGGAEMQRLPQHHGRSSFSSLFIASVIVWSTERCRADCVRRLMTVVS